MNIDRLILTSAESNCYLVSCARTRQALVIDPGDDPDRIQARLAELDLKPTLIVITHAHWDHVNAAGALADRSGAAVAMHPADADLLASAPDVTLERIGVRGPGAAVDRPSAGRKATS